MSSAQVERASAKSESAGRKLMYPSKRHSSREEFLKHLEENFSKQWDVCCQWHFQNRLKLYGSIQFESLAVADEQYEREV